MVLSKKVHYVGKLFIVLLGIVALSACGSDGDDDNESYIKFYNASYNAPSIYMTLDEDLDNDADDEFEQTFSSVAYGSAGSRIALDNQDYFLELAWQSEDSTARSDLEIIYEDQISIKSDITHWVVISDSIQNPNVDIFSVPNISDTENEQDQEDDVFNVRLINLHPSYLNIDVYFSKSDETFNEATLITTAASRTLTDNYKLEDDQYTVYLTAAGSTDVLFTSDEINYVYGGQYLIAVRENLTQSGSPFIIDNMTNTRVTEYSALESSASITLYNGLDNNELVPDYEGIINASIEGITPIDEITNLSYREFSDSFVVDSGDYKFSVDNASTQTEFLKNRVLSLPQNTNRTLFLYWTDEAVDDDEDGNVDENEDGIIDELRPIVSSLIVDNSERLRLYDKELTLLNLVNSDDFSAVEIFFVKSDEIIETAENSRSLIQGYASSIILLNNTYKVFVIANIDNNDIILDELTLTLGEETKDQFLILERSLVNNSGYQLTVVDQISSQD